MLVKLLGLLRRHSRFSQKAAAGGLRRRGRTRRLSRRAVFFEPLESRWMLHTELVSVGLPSDLGDDHANAVRGALSADGRYVAFQSLASNVVSGDTNQATDFVFRRGNDDAPAAWPAAADPTTISVRPGAGAGGSDRITLVWPDKAIPNGNWLQVTLLANAHTGLEADDVFYFGGAIGDVGNGTTDAKVNSSDVTVIRQNFSGFETAAIDNVYDFNREGKVNSADVTICRNHYSGFTPLKLIIPSAGSPGPEVLGSDLPVNVSRTGETPVPPGARAALTPTLSRDGVLQRGIPSSYPVSALSGDDPLGGDFGMLVQGVSQVTSPGAPGPVYAASNEWQPIVAGDDNSSFPSTFVMARSYGAGRVVVLGHDGILSSVDLLDNGRFLENVVSWLDLSERKEVLYTTAHGEWVQQSQLAGLAQRLALGGTTVTPLPGAVNAVGLASGSVLIVGDAWADFAPDEIEAVRQFVENGGGLCLAGCGWSWEPYHPGTTIEDYPMMKLAQPYHVRWLRPVIFDPDNQYQGSAVFHTFYPDIPAGTIYDAMAVISQVHASHSTTLPADLEVDPMLRFTFVRAHQLLAIVANELPPAHPQRQQVFDYYTGLVTAYPGFYAKVQPFDKQLYPTSAWLRERFWCTWSDCLDLTPERKAQIIAVGHLSGRYADVFSQWNVLLLDNVSFDEGQLDYLYSLLTVIPPELHNLRFITCNDFLGTSPLSISLIDGRGGSDEVNIFGVPIPDAVENSFPDDVDPGYIATFCGAAIHEINHVVHYYAIGGSPTLSARQTQLITDAGRHHMNYLRSMVPDGVFADAPQEFFASIANEWFADSAKTVQLGLIRFDDGRPDPINQALFFADVYSQGRNATWFYTTDSAGHITARSVLLGRDVQGRIEQLTFAGKVYTFTLDTIGNVTGYQVSVVDVGDVVGRYVFYNRSKFDNNSSAANANDDLAIATDKEALLPGGTAGFGNYTSYSRGINGIMVDVAGLPVSTLTATDFLFRCGNDDAPAAWSTAASPTTIAVRAGAGAAGSDRITLVWPDNAIPNANWLRVTLLANDHTGLAADDAFYFGCAIGETGNSTADAKVNSSDVTLIRQNFSGFNTAAIDNPYDFNREGKVNSADVTLCRNHYSGFTPLKLITPPAAMPSLPGTPPGRALDDAVFSSPGADWGPQLWAELAWLDQVQRPKSKPASSTPDATTQTAVGRLLLADAL